MHELAARALTLAHETLRCGVPHFREHRFIPIRTSAHLIVFDPRRISPLYTMLEVVPTDETVVDRKDNFSSGDITLPDELCTTEKHYENWNKANPSFPVDKGHSAGSQYRRGDVVEQPAELPADFFHSADDDESRRLIEVNADQAVLGHARDQRVESQPPGLGDDRLVELPADTAPPMRRVDVEPGLGRVVVGCPLGPGRQRGKSDNPALELANEHRETLSIISVSSIRQCSLSIRCSFSSITHSMTGTFPFRMRTSIIAFRSVAPEH